MIENKNPTGNENSFESEPIMVEKFKDFDLVVEALPDNKEVINNIPDDILDSLESDDEPINTNPPTPQPQISKNKENEDENIAKNSEIETPINEGKVEKTLEKPSLSDIIETPCVLNSSNIQNALKDDEEANDVVKPTSSDADNILTEDKPTDQPTKKEKEISIDNDTLPTPSNNLVVEVQNISKKYKNKYALKNFSIKINEGDIYGLIGKNGAGKSTLIKIITGLTEKTDGNLKLFGNEDQLNNSRKQIGSIIENPSFTPNMTAKQILTYYCKVQGITDKNKVDKLLTQVHLEKNANEKFKNFSLGMKQRLGIAFALMNNPKFVILDEPTNGLDPIGISELRDVIHKLNKEGVTFLICSHLLSELSQIATKYGIVDEGQFVKEFTNEELNNECKLKIFIITPDKENLLCYLNKYNYSFKEKDNGYEITLKGSLNDFIRDIVNHNICIEEISQIKTSLEDVFMESIKVSKSNDKEEV